MRKIDQPRDQIENQHREQGDGLLSRIGTFIGQVVPLVAPITGVRRQAAELIADFTSRRRVVERLNELYRGIRECAERRGVRLDRIETQMADPGAQEAVITAAFQTLQAPQTDKIRLFGAVLGAAFAQAAPDWERATEFIRDLEQLNDRDLSAMHLIWAVQYRQEAEPGRMHTDANRYTGEWDKVIAFAAERLNWHTDELYSRCGRLAGMGLAIEVQGNSSHQGPGDHCFRLTGKAVELLRTLGANPETLLYHEPSTFCLGGTR